MNMITIDAHSRDMVANIVEAGERNSDCFLWMCQLRSYWDTSLGDCRCGDEGTALPSPHHGPALCAACTPPGCMVDSKAVGACRP